MKGRRINTETKEECLKSMEIVQEAIENAKKALDL
jgi:hypothetical protein